MCLYCVSMSSVVSWLYHKHLDIKTMKGKDKEESTQLIGSKLDKLIREDAIKDAIQLFEYGEKIYQIKAAYNETRDSIHENIYEFDKFKNQVPDDVYLKYVIEAQSLLNKFSKKLVDFESKHEVLKKEVPSISKYHIGIVKMYFELYKAHIDCLVNAKLGKDIIQNSPDWLRFTVKGFKKKDE